MALGEQSPKVIIFKERDMTEMGHNRSGAMLKNFVERIERLEEQKKEYDKAKSKRR